MLPDWPGRTVVCIASGPSLTPEDCELVRASGHPTIVTNTTFRLCAWAHALFGYDAPWWRHYIDEVKRIFQGRLFSKSPRLREFGVEWAEQYPPFKSFGNSGACAISLAVAAGASRIVMLGYDGQVPVSGPSHHHGDHPSDLRNCTSSPAWPAQFGRLSHYVAKHGVDVVNASRATVLTHFKRAPLEFCL